MFNDWHWIQTRAEMRSEFLRDWLLSAERPVIIELGAGNAIPTVRHFGTTQKAPLIRINPTDEVIPAGREGVAIRLGAKDALEGISTVLTERGFF